MMYTMPKNLLSICVNFTLATQPGLCCLRVIGNQSKLHFPVDDAHGGSVNL